MVWLPLDPESPHIGVYNGHTLTQTGRSTRPRQCNTQRKMYCTEEGRTVVPNCGFFFVETWVFGAETNGPQVMWTRTQDDMFVNRL